MLSNVPATSVQKRTGMDTIDRGTTIDDERSEEPEGGALATVLLGVMVMALALLS